MILLGFKNASSKVIYEDTNRLLEKISGFLRVFFLKVLPQFMIWPTFVMSFAKYFVTDLGADAFEMPILVWCVYTSISRIDFQKKLLK